MLMLPRSFFFFFPAMRKPQRKAHGQTAEPAESQPTIGSFNTLSKLAILCEPYENKEIFNVQPVLSFAITIVQSVLRRALPARFNENCFNFFFLTHSQVLSFFVHIVCIFIVFKESWFSMDSMEGSMGYWPRNFYQGSC